jgi:hypothetical protein
MGTMTEPQWTSYVAIITGIIGAVAGLAGAIMSLVTYRRGNRMKSLDLWLNLRKAVNVLEADLLYIEKLMEQVNQSREGKAAANGTSESEQMMKWKQDLEADRNEVRRLSEESPVFEEDYHILTVRVLESTLIEVHGLQGRADKLRWRYESTLRTSNKERKQMAGLAEAYVQSAGSRKSSKITIRKGKGRFSVPRVIDEGLQSLPE